MIPFVLLASSIAMSHADPPSRDPSSGVIFPGDGQTYENGSNVHDPAVIQVKGKYFCFSTNGGGFALLRSSPDMLHWKVEGPIFNDSPDWIKSRYTHRSVWAPALLLLGDKLRMYYAVSNWGSNKSVIGMAECPNFDPNKPLNGWQDRGLVVESVPGKDAFNAIDPNLLVDDQGRHWLFFGSYFAGIQVVELDPATGLLKSPDHPNIQGIARNLDEKGDPLEGCAVCHRGAYYYLFVSYGLAAQGVRSTYRIMVGRAQAPTGPYADADGKSMVDGGRVSMLKTSPPMFGPGGNDVFKDDSGKYFMPFHYYDGREYWGNGNWGRPELQIRELLWSKDDWPLPGIAVGSESMLARSRSLDGNWLVQADFGEPWQVKLTDKDWKLAGHDATIQIPGRLPSQTPDAVEMVEADDGGYLVGRNQFGQVVRMVRTRGAR